MFMKLSTELFFFFFSVSINIFSLFFGVFLPFVCWRCLLFFPPEILMKLGIDWKSAGNLKIRKEKWKRKECIISFVEALGQSVETGFSPLAGGIVYYTYHLCVILRHHFPFLRATIGKMQIAGHKAIWNTRATNTNKKNAKTANGTDENSEE